MLDFPMIGKVDCKGKTRKELADEIGKKIIAGGYVSNALVNVQFAELIIFRICIKIIAYHIQVFIVYFNFYDITCSAFNVSV